jgi:hypothetical protein
MFASDKHSSLLLKIVNYAKISCITWDPVVKLKKKYLTKFTQTF